MQKRDILMDEIHRIGKIISQLVLGFKDNPSKQHFDEINNVFLEKTKLDINLLFDKTNHELKKYFENYQFTFTQLENISEYLIVSAEQERNISTKKKHAQTAKRILEYINTESETISFSRMDLEQRISKIL